MTVLTNFNNYEIGQCGFQGSVYSEMTDLSGVASTDYNITHSGIIIFESDSPVDTPNPTLTTGQYRFKIAQSNTDIVDDETSVTHTITVENTGQTDLTFNRVGLILAESATSAIGACFLVLCDEIEEVVVEPGMTVDFSYTIDLINFLNLYDPQIYIDIETPEVPEYDISDYGILGTASIDKYTGIASGLTSSANTITRTLDLSAYTPGGTTVDTFEFICKFRFNETPSGTLYLLNASSGDNEFFRIMCPTANTQFAFQLSTSASSSVQKNVAFGNTMGALVADKDYYIRFVRNTNGTLLMYYKFTEEETWTSAGQVSDVNFVNYTTVNPNAMTCPIAYCSGGDLEFDLTQISLKINDVDIITPVQLNQS